MIPICLMKRAYVESVLPHLSPKDREQFITQQVGQCRHNFPISIKVNRLCYATLLLEDVEIRKEFDLPNYENVFGDMYILLTALFLKANILTRDGALTRMAKYANVTCYHVPPSNQKP